MTINVRTKGANFERTIVNAALAAGLTAIRTAPMQTYATNDEPDVMIHGFRAECKCRETIAPYLWTWIDNNELLFLHRNRQASLVVMRFDLAFELLKSHGPRLEPTSF
jgi:hypothetical protein